jgi:hypothetical protein
MSYYGISAIKLNRQRTEVEEVKIHRAVRRPEGPPHAWTDGEPMHYTDVANLIAEKALVAAIRGEAAPQGGAPLEVPKP